jgi:hypothetical protein
MKTLFNHRLFYASLLVAFAVSWLLGGRVAAVSSPNYRLDWLGPLTGGGGPMSSANYQVNLTVGQSLAGASGSANYRLDLSGWPFSLPGLPLYLPLIRR